MHLPRSARQRDDLGTMKRLARKADVFANSYRPGVNKRFGLLPAELAAKSERGIVCMTANAYGHSGPWTERPGFDQNGQVASGFGRGNPTNHVSRPSSTWPIT
jgi:crotonobetainyl-CoA:carnitine CoA-transferase CaiB-like acyl-CoA transferase